MASLPYRTYLVESPASQAILRDRLDRLMRQGLFEGQVTGSRFTLTRSGWIRADPLPLVEGTWAAEDSGTVIALRARLGWFHFVIALLMAGFWLAVLGQGLLALIAGRPVLFALPIEVIVVMVVVFAILGLHVLAETGRAHALLAEHLKAPLSPEELALTLSRTTIADRAG